ncbi:MAG: hypothetical protein CMJ19_22315 [Phycisphaeraceae bacterium]|nr:hypothetical protein [Phycisphaeraceae bacterium]
MFRQIKIKTKYLTTETQSHRDRKRQWLEFFNSFLSISVPLWFIFLSSLAPKAIAQNLFAQPQPVKISAVSMAKQTSPGSKFVVAVTLDIQKPWHVNGAADMIPSDLSYLIPTQVKLADSTDWLTAGQLQRPEAHVLPVTYTGSPIDLPVYEGKSVFYLPVRVNENVASGQYNVDISVRYQTCDDKSCLAPKTEIISLPVTVGDSQVFADAQTLAIFNTFDTNLLDNFSASNADSAMASGDGKVVFDAFGLSFSLDGSGLGGMLGLLFVAMIGGALLNLTPCVLPVIPLKIMLLHKSAQTRGKGLLLGIFMSLGVLGFWLALGIAIAGLSGFSEVNQLFQYPMFTVGMGVVICALAIGMCGLFDIKLPTKVYNVTPKHDTFTGSVLFGIMTAVLSTPCTGPFMGAAAAWSATQPPLVTVAVFAAIGTGMAIPYLILSAFPALARKMPSAGPVSLLVKQILGLCLLAAGAYFLGVGLNGLLTTPPDEPGLWHWWLVCGILTAAGFWLAIRSIKLGGAKRPAAITWAIIGLLMAGGSIAMGRSLTDKGPIDWEMYTPAKLAQAQTDGKAVLVDFTAQWCLNCQVLEHQVLHSDQVVQLLSTGKVIPMKVDLTSANPDGSALLEKAGRVTIPLLVIYDANGKELFKSDSYTISQVSKVLQSLQ